MSKVSISIVAVAVAAVAAGAFAQKPVRRPPPKPSTRVESPGPEAVREAAAGPILPKRKGVPVAHAYPPSRPAPRAAAVVLPYRGTDISSNPELEDRFPVLKQIAERLSKTDYVPPMRREHFRWLDDPGLRLVGWHGSIKTATQAPEGLLVTVRIMPRLLSPAGGLLITGDHVFETYRYRNGTLDLADFSDPGDGFKGYVNNP
jgi:hypothetical protein